MTAFPSYSTGTVAISANGTTVAGSGSNWTGQNAMSGDTLSVAGFGQVMINSVTDATTLAIDAWPFGAVSAGTAYSIKKTSPLRFVGAATAVAVDQMVTAINTSGFYVFVGSDETVPDPSLGDDGQYALQATTGKQWQKEGGVWTFVGTFKGFGTPAPWDSATAYVAFDVVSFEGASYVCIEANTNEQPSNGDSPPNAFWTVLAAQGEAATITVGTVTTGAGGSSAAVTNSGTTGAAVLDFTIPAGEGYGGTSTTSLAIGTGSKAFTTQSGLAYTAGARVRASSAADTTNWMEGLATYSGTTLTVTVTKTNGSGTHADWNLNVAGEPGAGDLSSGNNLSDVASASTARTNLGLGTAAVRADTDFPRTDTAQSLSAAQQAQARANIGAPLRGHIAGLILSTAGSSASFGVAIGECADSTAVDLLTLTSALTKTTSAWAVGSSNGALDTGAIANSTWYHVYLIKRPDTGVVDILVSLSPTLPTLPTNYTLFRRIGSMKTDASSHWTAFNQYAGGKFLWVTPTNDVNGVTIGTTTTPIDLSTPPGIRTQPIVNYFGLRSGGSAILFARSPDTLDVNPGTSNAVVFTALSLSSSGLTVSSADHRVLQTGLISEIYFRADAAGTTLFVATFGWVDERGRDN